MNRAAVAVALAAVASLAACKKTGEGEYEVQKPVVGVQTDTVHTPTVDVGTDTTKVVTPKVEVKKDTAKIVTPKVTVHKAKP
jgi:hypothetical protein